tara:strand:+ start:508 stop:699 length:192 start_codon:yes stop_codon:yes gene_type:complete
MSEEIVPKRIEDPIFRLLSAKAQVENVIKLIEDNPYEQYMFMHLNTVKWELNRQLTNLQITKE